jgi:hypothetical protein
MVEVVGTGRKPATFNGPLEAGVRAVAVLVAAHPDSFDLQRLVALDYLLVHTGDIGGPESLHPPTPLHSAEILVRRRLVEQSLLLMMTRDLVQREVGPEGIRYKAGEGAEPFLSALQSEYIGALKHRAKWLVNRVGSLSDADFRGVMRRFFEQWVEEFQNVERSMGADQ